MKRATQHPHSSDHWFQSAVRYLARFDRTGAQVVRFLRTKGASTAEAGRAIERLSRLGYLDDRGYAERWIEGRLSRTPMGRVRLRMELLDKGLSEAVVDEAILVQFSTLDEETLARRALQLKQRGGRRLSPLQSARLLHQRGFTDETVTRIMGRCQEREEFVR